MAESLSGQYQNQNIKEIKLCLREKGVFDSTVLLRPHLHDSLKKGRATTRTGLGMTSWVAEGGCGEGRGGFRGCGVSLLTAKKGWHPLPRSD